MKGYSKEEALPYILKRIDARLHRDVLALAELRADAKGLDPVAQDLIDLSVGEALHQLGLGGNLGPGRVHVARDIALYGVGHRAVHRHGHVLLIDCFGFGAMREFGLHLHQPPPRGISALLLSISNV